MVTRDLIKEMKDYEEKSGIKILGIETDGLLTPTAIGATIDAIKDTLSQINLDEVAVSVHNDIKEFEENV